MEGTSNESPANYQRVLKKDDTVARCNTILSRSWLELLHFFLSTVRARSLADQGIHPTFKTMIEPTQR